MKTGEVRDFCQPARNTTGAAAGCAFRHSLEDPLRILFAVHAPWTDRLGVPRVSLELSRQLERSGHRCSHYSWEEAFPRGIGKWGRFFQLPLFQWKLLEFIKRRGQEFDVVQVESVLAPFPRVAYGFDGIMVAKCNGLPLFYEHWRRSTEKRLRRQTGTRGTWVGNCLRGLGRLASGGGWGAAVRTFATTDLIHVLNHEEQVVLSEKYGLGSKVTVVPNGLSESFFSALRSASAPSSRATSSEIAFVGRWQLRKGQAEFPAIVRKVREMLPQTSFHLVGTGVSETEVRAPFDPRDRASVLVQPSFLPQQLPRLLAGAKLAVFPSYVEGFPLGVLEMMAAGLPVVAWNVPGVRNLVAPVDPKLLVSAGDVKATAAALAQFLRLSGDAYEALSGLALQTAAAFTWQRSAACFLGSLEPLLAASRDRFPKTRSC